MTIINGTDFIQYDTEALFEIFNDIMSAMGRRDIFTGRTFTEYPDRGELEYTVYGKRIKKVFDMYTPGTPEYISDIQNWLFGMLDGAANI